MRFGVREICDVVFKPLSSVDIGDQHFDAMQPVLYLDTAKTSTLEGAATTVYAQGGKGNPRLIGWDGEKTLTFTVEDALMSPVSFAMLSGAGVVNGRGENTNEDDRQKVYVHQTYDLVIERIGKTDKTDEAAAKNGNLYAKLPQDVRNGVSLIASKEAPIYGAVLDNAGAQKYFLSAISQDEIFYLTDKKGGAAGEKQLTQVKIGNRGLIGKADEADDTKFVPLSATDDLYFLIAGTSNIWDTSENADLETGTADDNGDVLKDRSYAGADLFAVKAGDTVRIDCYAVYGKGATEMQIDASTFAGYYYIEASTLFRDEATGEDFPAEFIIPRGKIQSNFTFTMANSGDPSTFTFTIDAFPAYTKFNKTKKVMAVLQVIDPTIAAHNYADKQIIGHEDRTGDHDAYYESLYENSIFSQSDTSKIFEDENVADNENLKDAASTDNAGMSDRRNKNKTTETKGQTTGGQTSGGSTAGGGSETPGTGN